MNLLKYDIKFRTLHHIDINDKTHFPKLITNVGEDLDTYITDLIGIILEKNDDREYEPANEDAGFIIDICNILKLNNARKVEQNAQLISNKLLKIEKETQEKYKQITDIQKGTLIQSLIQIDHKILYLISKIEHSAFIDESDFKKHIGLPYEKRILKTCLIEFSKDLEITKIYVFDTNSITSNYWWNSFLELKMLTSDESNTRKAFESIENCLSRQLKTDFPKENILFRNNLIGYFKTNSQFRLSTLITSIIGDYQTDSKGLDIDKLKTLITKLPEKNKFDRSFNIIASSIRAKTKVIRVNEGIELNLKDYVTDLKSLIKSYEEENGDKYLLIKTDDDKVYEIFKN